ncbi:MAG: SDR family NAD(P)-dependent oxidoreductase [Gammaproteobacteria bacterium]|jgi:NAD(P)-dependent dehydrogenase (short-subunit alcohol dehydrogenase family)|nr:SDR family NAD(P)-dependent oxidoreductase [Gammaproteobacteria bacterium]
MTSRRKFLGAAGATLIAPQLSACGGVDKLPVASVPASGFGADATAEQVTEGLDLRGKLAVVTGCTSGIGFETMRVLAKRGVNVVGTSRSKTRAEEACRKVIGSTIAAQLDLADFDSVARCADDIHTLRSPIDILINNAGYRGGGNERQLINGVEKHFVINHLGHFILTNRLMDRLYMSTQGRIVNVASRAAYRGAPDEGIWFDDLAMSSEYSDSLAYGQSKLANVLFSLKLAELLRGTRITTNSLHPGVINTDIDRNLNPITRFGFGVLTALNGKTIEEGAATSCYVATSSKLGNISGRYFEDCDAITIENKGHMQDMAMADKLLQKSIELTADWLVEFKAPRKQDFE